MLIFRDAELRDLSCVVSMYADDEFGASRERATEPLDEGYLRAFREIDGDPRQRLVVVEEYGELVATLQLSFLPHLVLRGGERAQIEAVRVRSDRRGSGVGGTVLRWAINEARARGCRLVQLTTNRERAAARSFYEALGFQPTYVGMKLMLEHP